MHISSYKSPYKRVCRSLFLWNVPAKASRWCELACISEVATSPVGTWEGAELQPEARALTVHLQMPRGRHPTVGNKSKCRPFSVLLKRLEHRRWNSELSHREATPTSGLSVFTFWNLGTAVKLFIMDHPKNHTMCLPQAISDFPEDQFQILI